MFDLASFFLFFRQVTSNSLLVVPWDVVAIRDMTVAKVSCRDVVPFIRLKGVNYRV